MELSSSCPRWCRVIEDVLDEAGGALKWADLRELLLQRCAALGLHSRHLSLRVLASIPESFLSDKDPWVRRPRAKRKTPSDLEGKSPQVTFCDGDAMLDQELRMALDRLVVVDFASPQCGPCQRLKPEVAQLASELPEVCFLEVDVETNSGIADKYRIHSIPTFLFFKSQELLGRYEGSDPDGLTLEILQHK
ncbi:Thioredoxin [Symbiodinium microadriaticum]|uniref:Thioredoxin n=1 Tax=Symbiodinium microadriaticum TaxID=2951 RepID=A0A1Q9F5W6_SYMMI|nr:Thioredoxin [Symbiodinium microadriaticum]